MAETVNCIFQDVSGCTPMSKAECLAKGGKWRDISPQEAKTTYQKVFKQVYVYRKPGGKLATGNLVKCARDNGELLGPLVRGVRGPSPKKPAAKRAKRGKNK